MFWLIEQSSPIIFVFLLSQPVIALTSLAEETAKDKIRAVTGVYGRCCSHLVHIQKKTKKCFTHCFSFPQLKQLHYRFNFVPSHTSLLCFSLCMVIYICQFPLSSCSLLFSSSPLSIIPLCLISLSLLFQTHCSQTLLSPHINPSLPSSVPHNSIPTGSYIFLHLDTACVT